MLLPPCRIISRAKREATPNPTSASASTVIHESIAAAVRSESCGSATRASPRRRIIIIAAAAHEGVLADRVGAGCLPVEEGIAT